MKPAYKPTENEEMRRLSILNAYHAMTDADKDYIDALASAIIEKMHGANGAGRHHFGKLSAIELMGKLSMWLIERRAMWECAEYMNKTRR